MSCKENDTRGMAKRLFPKEKWYRLQERLYVAQSRLPKNATQEKIYISDVSMAKILADNGYIAYMLPETGKGKHPDALVNGVFVEFKNIKGSRNSVGWQYAKALKQANSVFLKVNDISHKEIKSKLVGTMKVLLQNEKKMSQTGSIFVFSDNKLVIWQTKKLLEIADEKIRGSR